MAKGKSGGNAVKVGLGVAAVAAAAAGAYFFYGPNGAKNRKNLKTWTVKAKAEVMEKVENLKDVTEKTYTQTVNQVLDKYKKLKHVAPADLAAIQKELKGSWKAIQSEIDKATATKSAKKKK